MNSKKRTRISIYVTCSVVFLLCLCEAVTGCFSELELQIYLALSPSADGIFSKIIIAITMLGNWKAVVLIIVILLLVPIKRFRYNIAFPAAAATIVSWLLNEGTKAVVMRARPAVAAIIAQGGYSFPSGHAMNNSTLYISLFYLIYRYMKKGKLKTTLLIVTVIIPIVIALSRVYVGVHYLTDIMGGFSIGIIIALTMNIITENHRICVPDSMSEDNENEDKNV